MIPALLSTSSAVVMAISAMAALAVIALVVAVRRRGARRRGYFAILPTALIVLVIFILFQMVGGLLAVATGSLPGKGGVGSLFLAENALAQLLVMLGGTVLVARAYGQDPFAVFRLEGFYETPASAYLLSVPLILSAQAVGGALSTVWTKALEQVPALYHVVAPFEAESDSQMQGLVTAHGVPEFALIFIAVSLVPAFAEETLFRGFAQANIERSGKRGVRPAVAILVSSVLFAAIHASVFKFPGLLALGLALGWMAYRTNNLFVGSLGHAMNNGLIVLLLYIAPEASGLGRLEAASGSGSLEEALMLLLWSAPFLALAAYQFYRATAHLTARDRARQEYETYQKAAWILSGAPADSPFAPTDHEEPTPRS